MKRLAACAALLFAASAVELHGFGPKEEPFPPKGRYTNSVHRYFPDLDARLNAVRYARWRALEIAWISGIDPQLDQRFSSYLLTLLADPPRLGPEADRVAPRFAREASPVFRALRWGQTLEQQVIDVLASPDASPRLSSDRLQRVFDLYRREPWALAAAPDDTPNEALFTAAPVSARILSAGTRLFATAAEDLAASDFGQQRWRVRKTVQEFDLTYAAAGPPAPSSYRTSAPTLTERNPRVGEALDRISKFREDVFAALLGGSGDLAGRRERAGKLVTLARRWGIPSGDIDAR